MAKSKPPTNTERVTRFMDFDKTGGLAQGFVIEAITRYANDCVRNPDETRRQMAGGFIHPDAWLHVAQNWLLTQPPVG